MTEPVYNNPTPIAVHMQSAWLSEGRRGLVVIRRPDNGGWAFPGGYVELPQDVSAEAAAAREFHEETGYPAWAGELFWSSVSPAGKLLLFVRSRTDFLRPDFSRWKPTPEAQAIRVVMTPEELCFPLHTEAMLRWFDDQ